MAASNRKGGGGGAAVDAHYVTTQAESGLSNEFNLGGLTTGILKHTVSGSVSTPATAVANTDYLPATMTVTPTIAGTNAKLIVNRVAGDAAGGLDLQDDGTTYFAVTADASEHVSLLSASNKNLELGCGSLRFLKLFPASEIVRVAPSGSLSSRAMDFTYTNATGGLPAGIIMGGSGLSSGQATIHLPDISGTDGVLWQLLARDNTAGSWKNVLKVTNRSGVPQTVVGESTGEIGFYGVTTTSRQTLATGAGATVDNVITALQTLGLVKQS